jgi:hypothetical protein
MYNSCDYLSMFMRQFYLRTCIDNSRLGANTRVYITTSGHQVKLEVVRTAGRDEDEYPCVSLQKICSVTRQAGAGSEALDWLCRLADAYNVRIEGWALPLPIVPDKFLRTADLYAWYKRHGFRVKRDGHIFRNPGKSLKTQEI